jgi:hypothetical protein
LKPAGISGIKEGISESQNELATNSNNKNIRDLYTRINEFKGGYKPRSNLVKDENVDLLVDSHILYM